MFRDKETKSKSENALREVVTPISDFSGTTTTLPKAAEKSPVVVARVPTPPTPIVSDKLSKSESQTEDKRLIVGRGISLNGKIASCDRLVIEGNVEAELENCHTVEVTESGTFKGAAEIASAEISGQYEGSLTVRNTLIIRASGQVSGTVRYGRLQIEDGGEINGDFKSAATVAPKVRAVPTN